MDDGGGADNAKQKSNNNVAMSPVEANVGATAGHATTPNDVMMEAAKLSLQRNLAQVAARAAAAAAAASHSRLSFSVDSLLGGGCGRDAKRGLKEQSEPKGLSRYIVSFLFSVAIGSASELD